MPVHSILPQLCEALRSSRSCVLCAPPGSGKTTVTPLALYKEKWLAGSSILLVEPRRLAARLTASYMADQIGEQVGRTVGYQVRFDRKISSRTRIEVITEGILMQRLQKDPELSGVGLVIFDEFHERSLQSDTTLAFCLDIAESLRDDLRLLIMSATLDTGSISKLLGEAPVISCQGKMYPVEVVYKTPDRESSSSRPHHIALNVASIIRLAHFENKGDTLAFLPGAGEINRTYQILSSWADEHNTVLMPLYGNLSLADQSKAVRPDEKGRRRVILSTPIAETSLTIEGISTVIDCGWKRVPRFDPNYGLTRLETVRISKASATQRQGRAGRLEPGVCYRLWSKETEYGYRDYDRPEILEADLAGLAIQLADWGCSEPEQLKWLDPPPTGAFAQARSLLTELAAVDANGRITTMGKKMAALPLHPRLAHMVIQASQFGRLSLACDIAALLTERDILTDHDRSADLHDRLHVLDIYRLDGKSAAREAGADLQRCHRVLKISKQLKGLFPGKLSRERDVYSLGFFLALAFPDRIARQSTEAPTRYKLVSGRGAYLQNHDPLSRSSFLVIAAMDAGKREGRIFMAADLEKEEISDLYADRFVHTDVVKWNRDVQAVTCNRVSRLGSLVMDEKFIKKPDPAAVLEAILAEVKQSELAILPWNTTSRSLQERVNCLRVWQPTENWLDLRDANLLDTLPDWLGPYLTGMRTRAELKTLNLTAILSGSMDWKQQKKLEQYAPTHIQVPSGSKIRLQYTAGQPPILSVRLQEMFGLEDTPTVCGGKVKVVLHLLSPAQRPIQVTSDLKSFWDTSYHDVKKDLKGRYPKHYWPDDPRQATPTRRVRPKK